MNWNIPAGHNQFVWNTLRTLEELKDFRLIVDDTMKISMEISIYGKKEDVMRSEGIKFRDKFTRDFGNLLDAGASSDLSIKIPDSNTGDVIYKVHKFILAARSPVFRAEIKELSDDDDEITIVGVTPEVMRMALKFIYTGCIFPGSLLTDEFKEVLKGALLDVAESYEIEDLKKACKSRLHIVENFGTT